MDDAWPSGEYFNSDCALRKFLTEYVDKKPDEIKRLAKEELGIDLD